MNTSYLLSRKDFYFSVFLTRQGVCREKFSFLFEKIIEGISLGNIFYECGVATGGTAAVFAKILEDANTVGYKTQLHLFDTFNGMPEANPKYDNYHKKGDIPSNIEDTKNYIESFLKDPGFIHYHKGLMPDTFSGCETHEIAFAHIDVDLYQSYKVCLEFIYPRLLPKGTAVFDDYGHVSCEGAKTAVDEFCLATGCSLSKVYSLQYYLTKS